MSTKSEESMNICCYIRRELIEGSETEPKKYKESIHIVYG